MAEQAAPKDEASSPEESSNALSRLGGLRRFLTKKWIVIVIVASVVFHGLGFACYQLFGQSAPTDLRPEVSLGKFRFEADEAEGGRIRGAELSLHVALLEDVISAAQNRMETHKFRVRQDVEELFRQAHSGDFEDPNLRELKRQLQAQINKTLDLRMNVVSAVIITDLKLELNKQVQGESMAETGDTTLWVDSPSDGSTNTPQ